MPFVSSEENIIDGAKEFILDYLKENEGESFTAEFLAEQYGYKVSYVKTALNRLLKENKIKRKKVEDKFEYWYEIPKKKKKIKVMPFSITISFKYPQTDKHPDGRFIEARSRVFYAVPSELERIKKFAVKETVKFLSSYSSILLLGELSKYRKTGITELEDEPIEKELEEVKEYTVVMDIFDWDYSKVRFEEIKTYDISGNKLKDEMKKPHLGILRAMLLQEELERKGIKMSIEEIMEKEKAGEKEIGGIKFKGFISRWEKIYRETYGEE